MCGYIAKIKVCIIGLLFVISAPIYSMDKCPLPQSAENVISCALEFHPRVKLGHLEMNAVTKLEDQASQIPNPTISGRYIEGKNLGVKSSGIEANLGFTLELGGKRSSRKEYARAQKGEVQASADAIRADIKIDTMLNLHRFRQLLAEKRLIAETLRAFEKVIRRLKKLPRLSAEQEASLTLFEIAYDETKVDRSELYRQERELERYFRIATGYSLESLKDILPVAPSSWPMVDAKKGSGESPEVHKLKMAVTLAQKELMIEKSKAWPDIKIGPSFTLEKEGGVENRMVGVNIEIPIPLFQLNGGGKAYAGTRLVKTNKSLNFLKREESYIRAEKVRVYSNAIEILSTTMRQKSIDEKHNRVEKLYLRGVVSSSLYLDSLKQKTEYLSRRHVKEIEALGALMSIYRYDGILLEKNL